MNKRPTWLDALLAEVYPDPAKLAEFDEFCAQRVHVVKRPPAGERRMSEPKVELAYIGEAFSGSGAVYLDALLIRFFGDCTVGGEGRCQVETCWGREFYLKGTAHDLAVRLGIASADDFMPLESGE